MPRRRRWALVFAGLAATLSVLALPGVASAGPTDPDGNTPSSTSDALDALSKAYYDAEQILQSSQQRQAEIKQNLDVAQAALAKLSVQIGKVASARYKGGAVALLNGLISDAPKADMLAGAAVGEYLLWRDDNYIHQYRVLKEEAQRQEALLNTEVELQTKQRDLLDKQKLDAERALFAQGGVISTTGYTGSNRPPAQPAPRNPDGSFPPDPCNLRDPTSGHGCITFRTYHMLTEVRNAGFERFVSCYRAGTWGEHPLGRACDFSVWPASDFVAQVASGDARDYGNQLAAWAVENADALGVLYVIWFKQIWTPRLGWHVYSGQGGDPASDHTNHVHISMR